MGGRWPPRPRHEAGPAQSKLDLVARSGYGGLSGPAASLKQLASKNTLCPGSRSHRRRVCFYLTPQHTPGHFEIPGASAGAHTGIGVRGGSLHSLCCPCLQHALLGSAGKAHPPPALTISMSSISQKQRMKHPGGRVHSKTRGPASWSCTPTSLGARLCRGTQGRREPG